MRIVAQKAPVLIIVAMALCLCAFPFHGSAAADTDKEKPCVFEYQNSYKFRIHPFPYGADTDIKVKYSALLDQNGTVTLILQEIDADPWSYARLAGTIVAKDFGEFSVDCELLIEVSLNAVTQDVLHGEIIPVYGPTDNLGLMRRDITDFSWSGESCPKILSVQPSNTVTFSGHRLSGLTYASEVKEVQGDVTIKPQGGGVPHRPTPGTVVKPGDTIETKNGGITFYTATAKVMMGAKTLVKLLTVGVDFGGSEPKTALDLVKGFLWARAKRVDNSLRIVAPNAICGVRGTSYKISHDPATTTTIVEVEDGVVTFSDPQSRKNVEVQAGMKSVIIGNGLPSDPVPIQR
jgi:hypothetical protein